jgi:hypothetical protein
VTFLSNSASRPDDRTSFARLLWKAFPADSELAVAEQAAPVLGISVRHARRLLRGDHDPRLKHFIAVAALVGWEAALSWLYDK